MAIIKKDGSFMSLPKGYRRGNPVPLDASEIWYSYEEMSNYAKNNPTAYVGQLLGLVDENNATATLYVILNVSGDLKEIGNTSVSEATGADNVSIILEDKKFTLKNYGKRYYRYTDEGYILQEVTIDYPWKAGLEPKVTLENEELVLGWYEPNTMSLEGVTNSISTLQTQVTNNETQIKNIADDLNLYVKKVEYQESLAELKSKLSTIEDRTKWFSL